MPKYAVYGIASLSVKIGEYVAESEKKAREMADMDSDADWNPTLCWHCSQDYDVGDIYDTDVEEIE